MIHITSTLWTTSGSENEVDDSAVLEITGIQVLLLQPGLLKLVILLRKDVNLAITCVCDCV